MPRARPPSHIGKGSYSRGMWVDLYVSPPCLQKRATCGTFHSLPWRQQSCYKIKSVLTHTCYTKNIYCLSELAPSEWKHDRNKIINMTESFSSESVSSYLIGNDSLSLESEFYNIISEQLPKNYSLTTKANAILIE